MFAIVGIALACCLGGGCLSGGSAFSATIAKEDASAGKNPNRQSPGTEPPRQSQASGQAPANQYQPRAPEPKRVSVSTEPEGAMVSAPNGVRGVTPCKLDLAYYRGMLTIAKAGYRKEYCQVNGNDTPDIFIRLVPMYAYLILNGLEGKSETKIDGVPRSETGSLFQVMAEVPHEVEVRSFEFGTYSFRVSLSDGESYSKTIMYQRPALTITKLALDPDNVRVQGNANAIAASFEISGPSTGSLQIRNQNGEIVYAQENIRFNDFRQKIVCNLDNGAGACVPVGQYVLSLVAKNDRQETASVSRAFSVYDKPDPWPYPLRNIGSGLSLVPSAETLLPGEAMIGVTGLSHFEGNYWRAPVIASARFGLSTTAELGAMVGFVGRDDDNSLSYLADMNAKLELWNRKAGKSTTALSATANVYGQWYKNGNICPINDRGLFSGLNIGFQLEESVEWFSFVVDADYQMAPISYMRPSSPDLSFNHWLYLRTGLVLRDSNYMAGLSFVATSRPFNEMDQFFDTTLLASLELCLLSRDRTLYFSALAEGVFVVDGGFYISCGLSLGLFVPKR